MTAKTSAGSTLKMTASQPATYDASGYNALSYTTLGEVTDLGEFGRQYTLVTHNPLATRSTIKKKGSYNEGNINLGLGLDNADAGQILAKAASVSDNDYSFCITIQDGTKYYFQAQVMSFKPNVGSVDKITTCSVSLELTSNSAGVGIVQV